MAAQLFGENVAYNLTPMLMASGPEFEAMREQAHELGLVMDETSVTAGATLNDSIKNVTESLKMMATNLGASLMPLVQQVMDFIIENLPLIQGMFDMLVPILQELFSELMPPLMDLARQLLPVIMQLIQTLLPPLTQIIKALLPIIMGLDAVHNELSTLVEILRPGGLDGADEAYAGVMEACNMVTMLL